MIEKLVEELQQLLHAKKLLELVWLEIGPYDNRGVFKDNPELQTQLNDFMKFDDSE